MPVPRKLLLVWLSSALLTCGPTLTANAKSRCEAWDDRTSLELMEILREERKKWREIEITEEMIEQQAQRYIENSRRSRPEKPDSWHRNFVPDRRTLISFARRSAYVEKYGGMTNYLSEYEQIQSASRMKYAPPDSIGRYNIYVDSIWRSYCRCRRKDDGFKEVCEMATNLHENDP